ncbi:MAG: chalcone isomerase [Flavobacteriales bacterium]|nr:chalcone isomerase [Flavobacteriales bacterium]
MKKISLIFIALLSFGVLNAQEEISGVTPEKMISVEGTELDFNGAGLREKFFLDLYVGALYLENKSKKAEAIIEADESMAITIEIVSGLISSEKMIDAVDEGFEKSTKGNTAQFKDEIASFKDAFAEEIVKGDKYVIAYIKNKGVVVMKNGKKLKTIPGYEFKKALFGIWLCPEPADEDLKEGMLGL